MKLGLGTAQFGIPYGATNTLGQVPPESARAMLKFALENRVDMFDTAPAYGMAEQLLGSVLPSSAKIVTKTRTPQQQSFASSDVDIVRTSLLESLNRLQRKRIYGLLLHSPHDVLRPGGNLIIDLLLELREQGIVEKVGVSVYTQEELESCLRRYSLDLYQLPMSYVDQRLVRSGVLKDLQHSGAEIHVRSVFLQGILLARPDDLPDYFAPWRDKLAMIRRELAAAGATPSAAGVTFLRKRTPANYAIVGATSIAELQELLQPVSDADAGLPFDDFAIDDEALIDPSRWPAFRT